MCLSKISKKRIAKEDITVYKLLYPVFNPAMDGVPFKGIIKHWMIEGIISIEDGRCYFCTNEKILNGETCYDTKGMPYSWVFDGEVDLPTIEPKIIIPDKFITLYKKTPIEIGKTYTSDLVVCFDAFSRNIIEIGLHSFVNIPTGRIVAECIIPKGSSYYIGDFDGELSIASDTLTYIKIIKNDTI